MVLNFDGPFVRNKMQLNNKYDSNSEMINEDMPIKDQYGTLFGQSALSLPTRYTFCLACCVCKFNCPVIARDLFPPLTGPGDELSFWRLTS